MWEFSQASLPGVETEIPSLPTLQEVSVLTPLWDLTLLLPLRSGDALTAHQRSALLI